MSFMNEFVETAIPNMDLFLSKISVSKNLVDSNNIIIFCIYKLLQMELSKSLKK